MAVPNATSTVWQISTDPAFPSGKFVLTSSSTGFNTTYKTSVTIAKDKITTTGKQLYARVRHTGDTSGNSAWSNTVSFMINAPTDVIGVALDNSDPNTKGTFFWIDANGNRVNSFDWSKHATYAGISTAVVDTARYSGKVAVTLTKFPKFYVRTATTGPADSDANGFKCWWISSTPKTGFRPAACFKRSTAAASDGGYVISDYCYMGTFLGHNEQYPNGTSDGNGTNYSPETDNQGNTVPAWIGSRRGNVVQASKTKAAFKTMIEARNDSSAGVTGFRMFDIWDLGALRLLLLVATADSDTQKVWGDNSEGTAYPLTGSTEARAVFKGTKSAGNTWSDVQVSMEDLWRCYWYHADLITVNTGVVTLTSPMDKTSVISFGSAPVASYTQPTSSGWIRDVLACDFTLGNDTHNLMELFLPGSVVSAENKGTFSDYHKIYLEAGGVVANGGRFDEYRSFHGIFRSIDGHGDNHFMLSSRLSKD